MAGTKISESGFFRLFPDRCENRFDRSPGELHRQSYPPGQRQDRLHRKKEFMSILFKPFAINGMHLKNRFVRSATWEGLATEDGAVTDELVAVMANLAEGDVGLIITGHAYVTKEGQAGCRQLGIYKDGLVAGLGKMVDAVHEKGGSIVAQLAHSGIYADPERTGHRPLAPSAIEKITNHPIREMTISDIRHLVADFGRAATRARSAGFDGVQIHAAHGYLFSQFLSPFFNHRSDEYGGELENRVRIHLEIIEAIRAKVGKDYPVLIKMNAADFINGGFELDDAVVAGRMLQAKGIDAIEVSGGTALSGRKSPIRMGIRRQADEAYFKGAATALKAAVDIPIILVGGIRSFAVAEKAVAENSADLISMCRPFIREPGLIKRWQAGDRAPAACRSDNLCFGPTRQGEGIYCVTAERERKRKSR